MSATEIETFRKLEEGWVRFNIEERVGRHIKIERPVVRAVNFKRHFGKQQTRPVVELDICLGNRIKCTVVNLVDRRGFNFKSSLDVAFSRAISWWILRADFSFNHPATA